jgi:antitoxin HicB
MSKAQKYPTHVYWDDRDNGFIAIAPDLPGCSAFGETREEALKELEPAIDAWIETAIAAGEPVPEPSPLPKPSNYSGKVLLRMPAALHERLAKDADAEGVSLNQWMVTVLSARTPFHGLPERQTGSSSRVQIAWMWGSPCRATTIGAEPVTGWLRGGALEPGSKLPNWTFVAGEASTKVFTVVSSSAPLHGALVPLLTAKEVADG